MFHGNNTYHLWKKNTDYTDAPSAAATSRFRELTFANCCRSRFVVAYNHLSIQSNAQAAAGAARRRREARSDSSLEQAFGLRRRERRVALSVWSVFFLNQFGVHHMKHNLGAKPISRVPEARVECFAGRWRMPRTRLKDV